MVERVCPRCHAGNEATQAYCGACGAALTQPLARRTADALARAVTIPVPVKEAGKVAALGLAAIAAEVGLALLQRRQQPLAKAEPTRSTARVIAVGRRISETWHNGQLQQRVEERVMWLMPDSTNR